MTSLPMRVAILGCTGSVGTSALEVCRAHADKLHLRALSAHTNTRALVRAAHDFSVLSVCVTDPSHVHDVALDELPENCQLRVGMQSAIEMCLDPEIDIVLVALVGAAGLEATYRLAQAGKTIALANKESLVVGGDLIMPLVDHESLIPVDSEHSAIYQCLLGENPRELHCIWLTCSGGPFYERTRSELVTLTAKEALAHPTWRMGPKISIDSATLMNKGLERIEAMHLFDVDIDRVKVLIQRESTLHSMVEFKDGSSKAHMGPTDMKIPIQFAFSYPERWDTPSPRLDYCALGSLTFAAPDMETFRCLALAEDAARAKGTMPCVLNAANEVAVAGFLHGACTFTSIERVVGECMDAHSPAPVSSLEQLLELDMRTRAKAEAILSKLLF